MKKLLIIPLIALVSCGEANTSTDFIPEDSSQSIRVRIPEGAADSINMYLQEFRKGERFEPGSDSAKWYQENARQYLPSMMK